jgi:hypothetical protein
VKTDTSIDGKREAQEMLCLSGGEDIEKVNFVLGEQDFDRFKGSPKNCSVY